MTFVILAVIYVLTSYMWYKIGFRSAVDASASLCIKLLMIIERQQEELLNEKTPQDG